MDARSRAHVVLPDSLYEVRYGINAQAPVQEGAEGLHYVDANDSSDRQHDGVRVQVEEPEEVALPHRERFRFVHGRTRSRSRGRDQSRDRHDGRSRNRRGTQRYYDRSRSRSVPIPSGHVFSGSSSENLDQDYSELFSSSAFDTAPWNSLIPFSLSTEDTECRTEKLQTNEALPGVINSPAVGIYDSKYTANDLLRGPHHVKLTTFQDPKKQRRPLFRWLHLQQDVLNFEDLQKHVSQVPLRHSEDRSKLVTLLDEVKQSFGSGTKLAVNGKHVSFMEPGYGNISLAHQDSFGDPSPKDRIATWLCMPYISYTKYSGLGAAGDPTLYPNQTLMQAHHSQIGRDRDMQQAICQTEYAKPGFCLHIRQLWCIVVGNSCLITCGEMSSKELQGKAIELVSEPLREPSKPLPSILVSYAESTWSLPLENCQSWPSFLAHFRSFWPRTLQFFYRHQEVCHINWSAFFDLTACSGVTVTLRMKTSSKYSSLPQPPPRGVLGSQGREASPQMTGITPDLMDQGPDPDFHVFMVLGLAGLKGNGIEQTVQNQLQAIDTHLSQRTRFVDMRLYEACENDTHQSLLSLLKSRAIPESTNSPHFAELHAECIDIFNAAEIIQRFYLPLGSQAPTVGKFWGAIHRMLRCYSDKSLCRPTLRQEFRSLTQPIQAFVKMISSSRTDKAGIDSVFIPRQLPQSWVHILMSLVHLSSNSKRGESHLFAASDLISQGIREAVDRLPKPDSLLGKAVVLPVDLAAIFNLTLLSNTGHSQLEIRKVYYECIQKLYSDITTKPSDRRLLQTTNLLQNELAVVHDVVETQARVIRGLAFTSRSADSWGTRTRVSGRDGDYVKLTHAPVRDQRQQSSRTEYTHRYQQILDEPQDAWVERLTVQGNPDRPSHTTKWQYGLKTWFIRDIERISSRDSQQYTHLVGYVRDLGETIEAEVNVTKDHQELAIYAFTIVTIVFLPLSSVASIFGMNTADIREMEVGQWLYWAVALPVTASVILLGLWWMGKLDSINKLSGRWSSVMTVKTGTEGSEASHNDFLPSSRQYRISSPPPELDDFIVVKPGQISRATYRASGATGVEAEHHRYRQSTGNFSRQRSGSVLQRAAESSRTMPLWIP